MKKFKKILRSTIILVIIAALLSTNALAASGSRYFLVADDVSTTGKTQINNICSNLTNNLGYTNTYTYLPTPATIHSNLPNYYVSVVHGHANPGIISCRQSNGTDSYYYSANTTGNSISAYAANALSDVKLILFICCYSALGPNNSTSNGFVATANNRGAKVAIGFRNTVAAGEWWANYFITALPYYTIAGAMSTADTYFAYYYPSWSGGTSSPDNTSNRYSLGSTGSYITNL